MILNFKTLNGVVGFKISIWLLEIFSYLHNLKYTNFYCKWLPGGGKDNHKPFQR